MSESLLEKLKQYGASDFYPLHMPGHKRRISHFEDPFSIDITEIEGFDDLHHARGILLEAQRRAARLYGADETYYLVNGSTCGILAAVAASTTRGGQILMARNSHKSCYHAAFLNDLRVTYVYPPIVETDGTKANARDVLSESDPAISTGSVLNDEVQRISTGCGICGSIRPAEVREALRQNPGIQAVLITSPTYDGVVSDIGAIAEAAHEAGAILIVDEAHGAHFGMHPYFPERALACGADIVINSLHKTLPSLTQTALLHVQGERADREKLRKYLDIYQTSSPSYVLMAGMDACVRLLEEQGGGLFDAFAGRLDQMRDELRRKLRVLRLVDGTEGLTGHELVYDFDRSKVLISTAAVSEEMVSAVRFGQLGQSGSCVADHGAGGITMTGPELADILRKKYRLEPEMAAANYVTAIMTVADEQEGFDQLTAALLEIDAALADSGEPRQDKTDRPKRGEKDAAVGAGRPERGKKDAAAEAGRPERSEKDIAAEVNSQEHSEKGTVATRTQYPANEEVLSIRQAQESRAEQVLLADSAGRISADYVYLYPPGIPLLVPGERISEELLLRLRQEQDAGLELRGMADDSGRLIRVIAESDIG